MKRMTMLCVANFFDRQQDRWGYALASDGVVGMCDSFGDISKIREDYTSGDMTSGFLAEKAFASANTIGMIGGAVGIPGANPIEIWSRAMSSLSGVFETIQNGKRYNDIPLLRSAARHITLIIAKRNPGGCDLYRVGLKN